MTTTPDRTTAIGPTQGQWLDKHASSLAPDDQATARPWKAVTVVIAAALASGLIGFGVGASLGADEKDARLQVVDLTTELKEAQRQREILQQRVTELEQATGQAG